MRTSSAAARLERALAAAGTPRVDLSPGLRDGAAREPRQPVVSPPAATVGVQAKGSGRIHGDDDAEVLLEVSRGAPVRHEAPTLVAQLDTLRTRAKGIEERLDEMQNEGLKARSLLRDVEGMVRQAIDAISDEGGSSDEESTRGSAAAPSRKPTSAPRQRAGAAAAKYGTNTGALGRPASQDGGRTSGGPHGGRSHGGGVSAPGAPVAGMALAGLSYGEHSEVVRRDRLRRCDELETAHRPVRREMDESGPNSYREP